MTWSMLEALKEILAHMDNGHSHEDACRAVLGPLTDRKPKPPTDNYDLWYQARGRDDAVAD